MCVKPSCRDTDGWEAHWDDTSLCVGCVRSELRMNTTSMMSLTIHHASVVTITRVSIRGPYVCIFAESFLYDQISDNAPGNRRI